MKGQIDEQRRIIKKYQKNTYNEARNRKNKKNLSLETDDIVLYCQKKIQKENCRIYRLGKNWYCEVDDIKITINAYSYTIITAHLVKGERTNERN